MRQAPVAVYLEVGSKKVFACSYDWPGWCRSGKSGEAAIAALRDYTPRYAEVVRRAGLPFFDQAPPEFEVVEELPGNATTDFGAPGAITPSDRTELRQEDAKRLADLVRASWMLLDDVVAGAPAELRKGPRGGGRDRDGVFRHVLSAEAAYGRSLGLRLREPDPSNQDAIEQVRAAIYDRIVSGSAAEEKRWPPRYAARRLAWHVLDHAWEIEDKSR